MILKKANKTHLISQIKDKALFQRLCNIAKPYFPEGSDIENTLAEEIVNRCIINYSPFVIQSEISFYEQSLPELLKSLKSKHPSLSDYELLQMYLNKNKGENYVHHNKNRNQ